MLACMVRIAAPNASRIYSGAGNTEAFYQLQGALCG